MIIKGKIKEFQDKVTGQKKDGSGEWVKQTIIVTTDETYNNIYPIEFFGEKVEYLSKYKVGLDVDVEFNISSNEWKGKYYVSLQGWRISGSNNTETALKHAAEKIDKEFEPAEDGLPF